MLLSLVFAVMVGGGPLVNDYHPWHDGGALTYADRFKK